MKVLSLIAALVLVTLAAGSQDPNYYGTYYPLQDGYEFHRVLEESRWTDRLDGEIILIGNYELIKDFGTHWVVWEKITDPDDKWGFRTYWHLAVYLFELWNGERKSVGLFHIYCSNSTLAKPEEVMTRPDKGWSAISIQPDTDFDQGYCYIAAEDGMPVSERYKGGDLTPDPRRKRMRTGSGFSFIAYTRY